MAETFINWGFAEIHSNLVSTTTLLCAINITYKQTTLFLPFSFAMYSALSALSIISSFVSPL